MATVAAQLGLQWRLGTTLSDDDTRNKFITPGTDADEFRAGDQVFDTSAVVPQDITGGPGGAIPNIQINALPDAGAGLVDMPFSDVYYRIWVVLDLLSVTNPQLDTDIPFILWNAFLVDNTLNTINETDTTGLTLDISTPLVFNAVEEKTVNLQITSAAPAIIDAQYEFVYDFGSGVLDFETVLFEWLRVLPDIPIVETWVWLSDVISAWDSNEQRISVRRQPRRRTEFGLLLEDESARRREYQRWATYLDNTIVVPFWQYHTVITADSAVSTSKIFFDREKTDFRDNDLAIILRPSTNESYLLRTSTIDADGANLSNPLTVGILTGDLVAPGFSGQLDDRTGLEMISVSGNAKFGFWITDFRTQFNRPSSSAVIDTFDGLNVLDRRPHVTRSPAPESFDFNSQQLDNGSGIIGRRVSWLHAMVGGMRQFTIPRRVNPTEMDYWRDFLTALVGQREPFLMPTWFEDLVLVGTPLQGSIQFTVEGVIYANIFFPHDTYMRLMLTNLNGDVIYRKVADAEAQPGDETLVTLETALPNDPAWGSGFTISYLNKVRLASDQVKLTHFEMYTILDLAVRTTDQ